MALTGGRNITQLAKDAVRLKAKVAVTCHDDLLNDLKSLLDGTGVEVAAGTTAIAEVAHRRADWTLSAIIGAAGLVPGLTALSHGTTLALANKESLVTAGPLLMQTAKDHGATILPVDSEHSAVFQALVGEEMDAVERIIITASGGAFRDWPVEKLAGATLAEASSHPNWDMGQRITIDSASMFNKGMEMIETKEFFGVASKMIEVLVHRESLVHALVGFTDGALMAHVGPPDMRHAIGFGIGEALAFSRFSQTGLFSGSSHSGFFFRHTRRFRIGDDAGSLKAGFLVSRFLRRFRIGFHRRLALGQHVANLGDVTHAKLTGVVAQEEAGTDVRRRSEIGQQGELESGAGVLAGVLHSSHSARALSQSY